MSNIYAICDYLTWYADVTDAFHAAIDNANGDVWWTALHGKIPGDGATKRPRCLTFMRCRNVLIEDCMIDIGDDCVTLKSSTQETTNNRPCEDIVVRNCRMLHGHGGIVIGSEMSGGVRNVEVYDCYFDGTERGIRLKTRRKRGGVVENVMATGVDGPVLDFDASVVMEVKEMNAVIN